MINTTTPKIFQPLKLGNITLNHRIIMAPMTRFKSDDENIPLDFVKEYYSQRACVPGTLLITEATYISPRSTGAPSTPGIWSLPQITAWKEITKAVHEKGSFIFCQLWALGRTADPDILKAKGEGLLSSSAVAVDDSSAVPTEMTEDDIQLIIADYARAAQNAIDAGFDGVEIHGANGYLVDQFIQDTCNKRTDRWGGSIANRSRFAVEVAKAVSGAVGAVRTGMRLSPFSPFQGMKMLDPIPQFTHLIQELKGLDLAYLHLIEPRISGLEDVDGDGDENSNALVEVWGDARPIILAGGFKPDDVRVWMEEKYPDRDVCVAFGRYFIPNPDLIFRIREDVMITPYDRSRFYRPRSKEGYLDYPFSAEFEVRA